MDAYKKKAAKNPNKRGPKPKRKGRRSASTQPTALISTTMQ
jgi:hypothetical protein